MKCEFCAGDLSIEDEICPHCAASNPFYEAHRRDMQRFEKKYNETERKVIEKADKSTKRSFYVAVIAVLILANIVCLIVLAAADEHRYMRKDAENRKHQKEYMKEAEDLLSEGKYMEFYSLMSDKYAYYYENPMRKFSGVEMVANYYKTIQANLAYIISGESYYQGNEEYARRISDALGNIYKERYEYSEYAAEDTHTDEMLSYMDGMLDEVHLEINTYLGIDMDTISTLKDLSPAKRQVIIEDAVLEVMADEEE